MYSASVARFRQFINNETIFNAMKETAEVIEVPVVDATLENTKDYGLFIGTDVPNAGLKIMRVSRFLSTKAPWRKVSTYRLSAPATP